MLGGLVSGPGYHRSCGHLRKRITPGERLAGSKIPAKGFALEIPAAPGFRLGDWVTRGHNGEKNSEFKTQNLEDGEEMVRRRGDGASGCAISANC
jgi:hypothetical protein